VACRALHALIDAQANNDLYRLQVIAQGENEDFNVAYIGEGFDYPHTRLFADDYLRHLFAYSTDLLAHGYPWHKTLPESGLWPNQ
jgi:hypothetical protein